MSQLKIDSEVATDNDKDEFFDLTDGLTDFAEKDIIDRYKNMIACFINYLQQNNLLKQQLPDKEMLTNINISENLQ